MHKRHCFLAYASFVLIFIFFWLFSGHVVAFRKTTIAVSIHDKRTSFQTVTDCPPDDPCDPDSPDTFDDYYPPPPVPVTVENPPDGACDDCGCFIRATHL